MMLMSMRVYCTYVYVYVYDLVLVLYRQIHICTNHVYPVMCVQVGCTVVFALNIFIF